MKYIDAEKLKAEIQWRIGLYHERGCGCDNAIEESLEELVSFIDSLQQEQQSEYIRKDVIVDAIKLAYGKVSMNPFDCSDAFEELLKKVSHEIH